MKEKEDKLKLHATLKKQTHKSKNCKTDCHEGDSSSLSKARSNLHEESLESGQTHNILHERALVDCQVLQTQGSRFTGKDDKLKIDEIIIQE